MPNMLAPQIPDTNAPGADPLRAKNPSNAQPANPVREHTQIYGQIFDKLKTPPPVQHAIHVPNLVTEHEKALKDHMDKALGQTFDAAKRKATPKPLLEEYRGFMQQTLAKARKLDAVNAGLSPNYRPFPPMTIGYTPSVVLGEGLRQEIALGGVTEAFKNVVVGDLGKYHDFYKREHELSIDAEVEQYKRELLRFYGDRLDPNTPVPNLDDPSDDIIFAASGRFQSLKNAYDIDDQEAKAVIRAQLAHYDKVAEDLKAQVEKFHKEEKDTIEADIKKVVKKKEAYEAGLRYLKKKDPELLKQEEKGLTLDTRTSPSDELPTSSVQKFEVAGVTCTEAKNEHGETVYTMRHPFLEGPLSRIFDRLPFRRMREDLALKTLVEGVLSDSTLKSVHISGGSKSQRKDAWLMLQLRRPGISISGYQPTANDLALLGSLQAQKAEAEKSVTAATQPAYAKEQTTERWVEGMTKALAHGPDFQRWFNVEGRADFEKWEKKLPQDAKQQLSDKEKLDLWWGTKEVDDNAAHLGMDVQPHYPVREKFEKWVKENPSPDSSTAPSSR